MVFLSIIIPIYNNSEEELSACLSSIRRLSKKISYEVLLIDDGSDIDHNNIYSKLIEGEKNIKLYRTINSGAAAARNFGVKKAIGNYIFFVDADDILPVQFVQDVSCIKNYQYDIIYGLVHFVEERSAINDK
ncbi:glycosyltransferase family A protein, partial [uncultured Mitsuokella sp.]|uniref:glycosyltransferase family 2 protein n=1 Tax=uncultured Mitsuokella sp. TaxID=453120 RepID=UPI00266EC49D